MTGIYINYYNCKDQINKVRYEIAGGKSLLEERRSLGIQQFRKDTRDILHFVGHHMEIKIYWNSETVEFINFGGENFEYRWKSIVHLIELIRDNREYRFGHRVAGWMDLDND